jgi:hypothetical protein
MPINERGEFVRERSVGGKASSPPASPPYRPSPPPRSSSSSSSRAGWALAIIAALVLVGSFVWNKRQRQQTVSLPVGTSLWRGAVGSSAATLDLVQSTPAGWLGRMTYQGVIEDLAVTVRDDGTVVLMGKSYRRLKGNGSFALDTFDGRLSPDGQQLAGSYVDSRGNRGRWAVARTSSVGHIEPPSKAGNLGGTQGSQRGHQVGSKTGAAARPPALAPTLREAPYMSLDEMAALIDADIASGDYDKALGEAERAVRFYPRSTRAQALLERVRRIKSILK